MTDTEKRNIPEKTTTAARDTERRVIRTRNLDFDPTVLDVVNASMQLMAAWNESEKENDGNDRN